MFSTIEQAIDWVTNRKKSDFPFSDFNAYLKEKGNPQYGLKCIHVAGTNGKGSTTNYLRNILQTAGYKVGSFTSPHLVTHLDRIRINDINIDSQYFLDMVNQYQKEWEEKHLSMFQIDMFISIMYFLEKRVDYVIYEVGLGGRLDATNVIKPIGAVITNIEKDHMQILGDTFEKIAIEKGGIIKEGLTVVTFEKKKEVLDVFRSICNDRGAKLVLTKKPKEIVYGEGIRYQYKKHEISIPTSAVYQILNSCAAIELIDQLNRKKLIQVNEQQLVSGLQTSWAGRFEKVNENPLVIIDGAHNENGIDGLCASLDSMNKEYVIVFSALKDKEYHKMLGKLVQRGEVIVTEFENYRMSNAKELALGYDVEVESDYIKAIEKALERKKTVIITGSLYFISIVREYFMNKD